MCIRDRPRPRETTHGRRRKACKRKKQNTLAHSNRRCCRCAATAVLLPYPVVHAAHRQTKLLILSTCCSFFPDVCFLPFLLFSLLNTPPLPASLPPSLPSPDPLDHAFLRNVRNPDLVRTSRKVPGTACQGQGLQRGELTISVAPPCQSSGSRYTGRLGVHIYDKYVTIFPDRSNTLPGNRRTVWVSISTGGPLG